MENLAIHRSSYVNHFMDLNKLVVCGINISVNIFFLMDLRMMIFIKHYLREFVIIAIYVDDLNIIGTSNAIDDVVAILRFTSNANLK